MWAVCLRIVFSKAAPGTPPDPLLTSIMITQRPAYAESFYDAQYTAYKIIEVSLNIPLYSSLKSRRKVPAEVLATQLQQQEG